MENPRKGSIGKAKEVTEAIQTAKSQNRSRSGSTSENVRKKKAGAMQKTYLENA